MQFTIEQLDLSTIQTLDDLFYSVTDPTGFLIYIYDEYPTGKKNVCNPYKDKIPTEGDITNSYGGGDYEAMIKYKPQNEPIRLIKSIKFKYEGVRKNREITGAQSAPISESPVTAVAQVQQSPPENKPGFMGMNMEAMKEFMQFMTFMDQMRGGHKGDSEFGVKEILAMNERATANLIEVLKGNNGGNSKMENFAFELLKEKRDPFLDMKNAKEMIDLFKGEAGSGESGGMFENIIEKIGVPLIGAAMSQNDKSTGDGNIQLTPDDITTIANAIIEMEDFDNHLKGTVLEVLVDYGILKRKTGDIQQKAQPQNKQPKDTPNGLNTSPDTPLKGDKTGKHPAKEENPAKRKETALKTKSPINTNKGGKQPLNVAQKAIIEAIKMMPIGKQDELLKDMLNKEGYQKCKDFCVDNKLTENEDTFKQRMEGIGIDISKVKP